MDGWQMECCGRPFRVGDVVEWTLSADKDLGWLADVLGSGIASQIGFCEDHHGGLPEDAPVTRGKVRAIQAVRWRYEAGPGGSAKARYPVPGTAMLASAERADGRESQTGEACFAGYLVDLDVPVNA
jgi:hypothetical protein